MKRTLDFDLIAARIRGAAYPEVDAVVGIGSGGAVPAALIAFALGAPLYMARVSYRDADNQPLREAPLTLAAAQLPEEVRRVLLVDDVAVTGKSLEAARAGLEGREVVTLVLKGYADIVLFPEVNTCVHWPWNPPQDPSHP